MTDRFVELTRRKILGSVGTVGAAGAAAGLGTSALFSDQESFTNNSITAGTLDMAVTGEIVAANQDYIDDVTDITGNPITVNGDVQMGFDVQDLKPGDWFIVCITVDSVAENPFYLTMFAENLTETGRTTTEPEPTPDDGELGKELFTTVWGALFDSPSDDKRDGLFRLDASSNASGSDNLGGWDLPNYPTGGTELKRLPNSPTGPTIPQNGGSVEYTTLRELVNGAGVPGSNGWGSSDGILVEELLNDDAAEIGSDVDFGNSVLSNADDDKEGELVFYLLFELPTEVGNSVQGDELSLDLRFSAEQVRNNDGTGSGSSGSSGE